MRSAVPRSHILTRVELLWTVLLIVAALSGTGLLGILARRLHTGLER